MRHDNTLARPYIGWEQKDRVDIVLTNPPFGGKEEDGIESNFPQHFPNQGNRRPVPGPDRAAAEARRARRRGAARRLPVRRGRQDAAQGAPAGGVQPAHHRAPAQLRLQALCLHRHQPAVLREGRAHRGHLVLRTSRASGPESLLHDQAHPAGTPATLHRLVGRGGTRRTANKRNVLGK